MNKNNYREIKIVTIGVYGYSEAEFFDRLRAAQVDLFCDIRMRRGMRGSKYAFANSKHLQKILSELGISYIHFKEFAPSQSLRNKQKMADAKFGTNKTLRKSLSQDFISGYQQECLTISNILKFLESAGLNNKIIALFCVEREPLACHRSLVAAKLQAEFGLAVEDIKK